jgi:TP901-1 family phage major tail protein
MATAGVINSRLLRVYTGASPIAVACATDAQFSVSTELRDATCKDTGGWRDILPGLKSGQITTSGLYKDDDAPADGGFVDLYDDWAGNTSVTVRFSTEVTGDTYWEASAYITSLELSSSGVDENVTYSATFEIAGTITKATGA